MSTLGLRRRLLLAVIAAVTVALVTLVAGFNVILARVLDHDANSLARSRAVAELDSLRTVKGRLSVGEAPDDGAADAYVWVFAGRRPLEQPSSSISIARAAQSLAGSRSRYLDVPSSDTRLYAVPVLDGPKRIGTVVAGVSLAAYESTRKLALLASLVLGAIVVLLVGLGGRWALDAALRPVARMTRQAAEWSEHDLEQRFGLGPPHDELTELAATLDALLDRLAASLRRERRFSAELSHELRTPLARVIAEVELALRRERNGDEYREALQLIQGNADQLARTVDALVTAARYEGGGQRGTANASDVAGEAIHACRGIADERDIDIAVHDGELLRLGLDADLAERILQPILENACRYSATSVEIRIRRDRNAIVYEIDDDGPGVEAGEREHIFDPGVRGSAPGPNGHPGAGLGLALARRLARSVDGDVNAELSGTGGRFLVRLPAA